MQYWTLTIPSLRRAEINDIFKNVFGQWGKKIDLDTNQVFIALSGGDV